ncbi:hypothetical protein GCK72_023022 [Caenorhabditis remanei]|uniref:Uncharacterized protein n=1 Tax=Caenorhabditis remanei TaxID=31234 RepID=A0A6A5FVM1_CAERE|nr:hypothetical protein GCK72_023022 [Caenorhabditis remanei]KAF1746565.1 hypothetical protein GCK72_023022 [Caenorhabditis remanei]
MKDSVLSHRQQGDFGRKRLENQANVQSTKFRDLAKNGYWFESVEHDIEDVYCGYRPRADRSIALKKNKKSKVMERSQRSDDSHYIHHERIVYEPRRNLELLPPLKPIDNAKELEYPNKEVYAMNNAKLFSQRNSQEKYPYSLTDVTKNMDVIKVPTTEAFKKYFNGKLTNPTVIENKKKKLGVQRRRKQIVQKVRSVPLKQRPVSALPPGQANPPEGEFERDADGRLIPTFSELFFSYEKTENYNNLIRDYLSMAGIGHTCYSADFKCRILIGFITKNFKIVFDNKLGDIFEKHLQLMGIFCSDWKKEHFQVVREKFLQLKNEWKEQNNQ